MQTEYDDNAVEFLEKLPLDIARRIVNKIESARENPFHFFFRLTDRLEYKLRVGEMSRVDSVFFCS